MAVIYYQIAIIASLIVVSAVSPKRLLLAALIWTGLTIINLFYPPLIIMQIAVIWGGYTVLKPRSAPAVLPAPTAARANVGSISPDWRTPGVNTPSAGQSAARPTAEAADVTDRWLIRNRHDHELYWDGSANRWDMLSLSTQGFTHNEKAEHVLPPAGEWVRDN